MFNFQFYFPTKIVFGVNKLIDSAEEFKTFGKKALIVAGKESFNTTGIFEKIKSIFKTNEIQYELFKDVSTNPLENTIIEGANLAKRFKPDMIITIGGGSVHDAGKAISLLATHQGNLHDYSVLGKKSVPGIKDTKIRIITIPTISGTGAEISPAALVRINNKKEIIFSPNLYPKLSIIDPSIMVSSPPALIAQVGIDAFIQGLEAFLSKNAQPFSDVFAFNALRHSIEFLPKAVNDPNNIEARGYVALAAIESLFAVAQAGVGAIHALSDPLSGYYNVHHGLALAILAPEILKINMKLNKKKLPALAKIYNIAFQDKDSEWLCSALISHIEKFFNDLGLAYKTKLETFGVNINDISKLVQDSKNPDMSTNIKELDEDEIKRIFMKLM